MDEIITPLDFREFVYKLIKRHSLTNRTIGEYLRALWADVLDHKDDAVTYALLAHLIEAAYLVEPLPFNNDWLKVKRLGWHWDEESKSYIIKEYNVETKQWFISEHNVDPFRILKHTLLEQISERYLLENTSHLLTDKQRRQLANDWSNPEPGSFLGSALHVLYSDAEQELKEYGSEILDWAELTAILSIGQVYD